jgi:hypothetical protein
MTRSVRRRFWWETALAVTTGFLAVLTGLWHEWIEALGFHPDHGDGSAEWLVVVVLAVVCIVSSVVARTEWRRPRLA